MSADLLITICLGLCCLNAFLTIMIVNRIHKINEELSTQRKVVSQLTIDQMLHTFVKFGNPTEKDKEDFKKGFMDAIRHANENDDEEDS